MEDENKISEEVEDETINEDERNNERSDAFLAFFEAAKQYGITLGKAEGEFIGYAKGKAEGEAIGKTKNQKEIAKAMLEENIDKSLIARVTKLPLSQIMML